MKNLNNSSNENQVDDQEVLLNFLDVSLIFKMLVYLLGASCSWSDSSIIFLMCVALALGSFTNL